MKYITNNTISEYIAKLNTKKYGHNEVVKKVGIVTSFIDWMAKENTVSKEDAKRFLGQLSKITHINPTAKPSFDTTSPKGTFPIRYVGYILLALTIGILGTGLYNRFFLKTKTPLAFSTSPVKAGRTISFQGRLTDSLGNPITAPIDITYNFYTDPTGGSPITDSTRVCTANGDVDGVFSSLIGNDLGPNCSTELPDSIFTENPTVYLGVTVGSEVNELSPRQQIANVGYAINAETLQGMPPGQTTSTVPFINQDGDLLVAVSNPGIRSTIANANFTISSAQATTIQSAGSGDITLSATEGGALRFNTYNGTLGERMTILASGNVGISNTNPTMALDIVGSATTSGNLSSGGQIKLGELTSAPTSLGAGSLYYNSTLAKVYYNNGTVWTEIGAGATGNELFQRTLGSLAPSNITDAINTGAIATSSAIVHLPGTTNQDAWFNLGTGNVGIGTITPGAKLEVNTSSGAVFNVVQGGVTMFSVDAGGNTVVNNSKNLYSSNIHSDGGWGNITLTPDGAGDLHFATDADTDLYVGTDQLFINGNTGNIGIGNAAPTAKLDVTGNLHVNTYATVSASLALGTSNAAAGAGNLDMSGHLTIAGAIKPGGDVGTNGYVLTSSGGGVNTWVDPTTLGGASVWQRTLGSLAPLNITDALNLGATATSSAIVHLPGTTNQDAWFNLGTGNVGIGTTTPTSKLQVGTPGNNDDFDVNFYGWYNTSPDTPVDGRFYWDASKGALRFGSQGEADAWSDANTGKYSLAGYNDIAAEYSTALGANSVASGSISTAIGTNATASGDYSVALGFLTTASGTGSTAMGWGPTASGYYSTAMGVNTTAQPFASTVIGQYNTISGTSNSWVTTDPLFIIGNGTGSEARSDALTVLKNGNVGIGVSTPTSKLDVTGNLNVSTYATVSASLALGTSNATAGAGNLNMSGNLNISSLSTGILHSISGAISSSALNLAGGTSEITGLLGSTNGGTGADNSSAAQYSIPYYSATGVLGGALAPGTGGYVLSTNGAGGAPSWISASGVGVNYWQKTLGSLAALDITDDINTGAVATGSALVHLPGTNNQDAWFNLGTGNVGIGTITPTSKVEINGTYNGGLGTELITNGTFTGNANGWTLSNSATYDAVNNDVDVNYSTGTDSPNVSTTFAAVSGKTYLLTFTLSNVSSDLVYYSFANISQNVQNAFNNGTNSVAFTSDYTGTETISFHSVMQNIGGTWTIDNVSIKEMVSTPQPALKVIGYDNATYLSLGGNALDNTAIGKSSLGLNTLGASNTALGNMTLSSNTEGSQNVAIGSLSLGLNTTGTGNTALGSFSQMTNTTGMLNTSIGYFSLLSNTTGTGNTALGSMAGYMSNSGQNKTSNYSLYLGYTASPLADGDTNEIVIGANTIGAGSNTVTLGDDNIITTLLKGNVGIGTTPTYTLDVAGDINATGAIRANGDAGTSGYVLTSTGGGVNTWTPATSLPGATLWQRTLGSLAPLNITDALNLGATATSSAIVHLPGTTNQDAWFNLGTGNVGIGTTTPTSRFQVYSSDGTSESLGSSSTFSSSGTAKTWNGDDALYDYTIPFSFPFYGENITDIQVSTNGVLWMCASCGDSGGYPNSALVPSQKIISPLWADLITNGSGQSGEDVYVDETVPNQVTIMWKGEVYGSSSDVVNFSATLHSDGTIVFKYGSGNTNLQYNDPSNGIVAVSDGDGNFLVSSISGATSQTNTNDVTFTTLSAPNAFSIDTASKNIITARSSGRIGIGTTTPNNLLQVAGLINFDSANNNTFLGTQSGYSNTTGSQNVAIGDLALYTNATGSGNMAIGPQSLFKNNGGEYNTAFGLGALYENTTGNGNFALGYAALAANMTGSLNIAIGAMAGNNTSDANNSIYIGNNAQPLASGGKNEIVIGNRATGAGSNTVTLGDDSIITTLLKGNVGIGTTPDYALDVAGDINATGAIRADGDAGTSGYILTSSGGGVNTWTNPASLGGATLWQRTLGSLAPLNITDDINIGSTATASALVHLPGTNNKDAWFNLGTGNVGIGTMSPTAKLQVEGSDTTEFEALRLTNDAYTTNELTTLSFYNSSYFNKQVGAIKTKLVNSGASSELQFWSLTDDSPTQKVTIDANGNVGVGTTIPDATLNVNGTFRVGMTANEGLDFNPGSGTLYLGGLSQAGNINIKNASSVTNISLNSDIASYNSYFLGGLLIGSSTTTGVSGTGYNTSHLVTKTLPSNAWNNTVFDSISTADNAGVNNVLINAAKTSAVSTGLTYSALKITESNTGADTAGTVNLYGVNSNMSATSSVNAATHNTYAGYFSSVGNTNGTSTTYGLYTTASGADTNYALYSAAGLNYFSGNVGIGTAPTTAALQVAGDIIADQLIDTTGSGAYYINPAGSSSLGGNVVIASTYGVDSTSGGTLYLGNTNAATIGIGTSATARTITLGNITGATAINFNTGTGGTTYTTTNGIFTLNTGTGNISLGTDAAAKIITLGNVTGATAVNVNTGTGGTTYTTTNGIFTLNTGTGTISLGTDAAAKTITLGNSTGATAISLNTGTGSSLNLGTNAIAHTVTIGNVTGATAVNVNTGTAGTTYTTTNGIFTLNTGTGNISLGTDAAAKTLTLGNATGATALALNSGTGNITLTSTNQIKLNSSKAAGGTTTEALSFKSTVDLGTADELLQIGDSALDMVTVLGSGNVGIGTTSPSNALVVGSDILGAALVPTNTVSIGNDTGNSLIQLGQASSSTAKGFLKWNYNATPADAYLTLSTASTQDLSLQENGGYVGIGTTVPAAPLHVAGTPTGTTQYGAYFDSVLSGTTQNLGVRVIPSQTSIASSGFYGFDVRPQFSATSGGPQVSFFGLLGIPQIASTAVANVTSAYGGYFRADNLSAAGSVLTNSYGVYAANPTATGTITNAYGLYIPTISSGSTLNYSIYTGTADSYFGGDVYGGRFLDITGSGAYYVNPAGTSVLGGNIEMRSATPSILGYDSSTTTYYTLHLKGQDNTTTASVSIDGSGSGDGKLDVGTVDPPYTIDGKKYATYLTSMTGVKEETTGVAHLTQKNDQLQAYTYTINFNTQDEASDLWLFSKTTNLKQNIKDMTVLLSSSSNGKTWYTVDKEKQLLTFFSTTPTDISYRLTAPRFDASSWANRRDENDSNIGFVINSDGTLNSGNTSQVAYTAPTLTKSIDNVFSLVGDFVDEFMSVNKALIANLKTGFIETEDIIINNALTARETITTSLTASVARIETLIVSNRIKAPVVETVDLKASGSSELASISTNNIKPLEKDVMIDLSKKSTPSGSLARLVINGLDNAPVATFDSTGNATLSGTLVADQVIASSSAFGSSEIAQLSTNNASVSGTLVAKEIQADNINSSMQQFSSSINDVQQQLAALKTAPLADVQYYQKLDDSVVGNITITDTANIYKASISDSLMVGSLLFEQNSLLVLSSDLKISSLSTIHLFDDAVVIAKNGIMSVKGEISASALAIKNTAGETVASIDASGSARFNEVVAKKFTLDKIATNSALIADSGIKNEQNEAIPAIKTNMEVAGTGVIPQDSKEVAIYNDNVTSNSLIYLTPTTNTTDNQLSVTKKFSCPTGTVSGACTPYFVISSNSTIHSEIPFNWLIIN